MDPRRRLPFPDLPERRRSRVNWGVVLALLGFGITVLLVIRAVRQPGISALPPKVRSMQIEPPPAK